MMHENVKQNRGVIICRPVLTLDKRKKTVDYEECSSTGSNCSSNSLKDETTSGDVSSETSLENVEQEEETFCIVLSVADETLKLLVNNSGEYCELNLETRKVNFLDDGNKVNDVRKQIAVGTLGVILPPLSKVDANDIECVVFGECKTKKEEGTIVRKTTDRLVMQLYSAPATRVARLVLIHDQNIIKSHDDVVEGETVIVWFCARKIINKENQKISFYEGIAMQRVQT